MSNGKKLNRNAFSEKLLHRYLLERYYFADTKTIRTLLPEKYISNRINLITPEETRDGEGYRADLTIYFKGKQEGVPVEVKWNFSDATKSNQVEYLRGHGGFVVALGGAHDTGLDQVLINKEDFSRWVSENISKLTRESIQSNVGVKENGSQTWFVFLRGTAHDNFNRMLKEHPRQPFWAYVQNGRSLRHILDVQKGDTCIFVLGSATEGVGVAANPSLPFEYYAWYRCRITEPYYMVLSGPQGTFFESGDISVGERRWPHFTSFVIEESYSSTKKETIGERGDLAAKIALSYNYGSGAPVPLSRIEAESLLDRLRARTLQTVPS